MEEVIKAATSWSCVICLKSGRKGARVVSVGGFYRHPKCEAPVSDPAPTVDAMDDTTPGQCPEPKCTCGGDGGPGHELAVIAYGDDPVDDKGPWFGAMYDGTCSDCDGAIFEGDRIRADGQGGYECEDCGDVPGDELNPEQPLVEGWSTEMPAEHQPGQPPAEVPYWQQQASAAAKRHLASPGPRGEEQPVPDVFEDPTPSAPKLNVSGQPKARRDHMKRYILVDPGLGDFRRSKKEKKPQGITRATTFNKAAQNTTSLNAWGKRNVVMGASLRPDILRRAHGLTHATGKDELDRIVDELETAAGAKVAADEGTFLHKFCDQVDAGLKTWRDAPPAYQQDIKRYVEALAEEGLEPVPGLIERTTFIREYGGVAGTFDRIFYHRPSGQYIVGDLKTGKTMKYAMDETECQIWTYAHGVNQSGIYNWNTDTWGLAFGPEGPVTVSEKVGVIIHMPVQGPEAGEVYPRFANLVRGRAYADLNHAVRAYEKSKVLPFELSADPREPVQELLNPDLPETWQQLMQASQTVEEARTVWVRAAESGASQTCLDDLQELALVLFPGKG